MQQDHPAGRPFTRVPVLYVEDHPVNVMLMEALFERRPALKLVVATTGEEALRAARGLHPALLLLDLRLPDTRGSLLLPQLRRVPGCEAAPAVAVTADIDFALEESDFDELWAKPLNLNHVLERLDALAGRPAVPTAHPAHPARSADAPGTPASADPPDSLPAPLHDAWSAPAAPVPLGVRTPAGWR